MHHLWLNLFWVGFGAVALVISYLTVLTLASFFAPVRARLDGEARTRFALLVPAHNEEAVIGELLDSLQALDYSPLCYSVFVVADNCTDATARVARAHGARVFERFDEQRRGKGHALQWLLEQVASLDEGFDAFVIFDADSQVSAAFLRVMDSELARGGQVLQAHYGVLNPGDGAGAALRYAALALVNFLRPLGKNALGCATGLKGNGMCFSAAVMARYGWGATSLAEDAEFGVRLLLDGIHVRFVPAACVWAQMPPGVEESRSQNMRWEAGRLFVVRNLAPRLLSAGVRHRSGVLLEAAVDLLMPPLSVMVAGIAVLAVGAWGLHAPNARFGVALLAGALVSHVGVGLARIRAPFAVWRSLMSAPVYCLWKLALYTRALVCRPPSAWIRTRRFPTG